MGAGRNNSELKTLEDFETLYMDGEGPTDAITIDDLRSEAIKWIKELKEDHRKYVDSLEPNSPEYKLKYSFVWEEWGYVGAISMLEHFFNLTEEDLK